MDLLAAWLLFPLALGLLFLGWGLLIERVCGRELPGVLLLPLGLVGVLVVSRVLVVSQTLVSVALPFLALVALAGLVLARARLRALRPDPWAVAAAFGAALAVGAPVIFSGEPTFTGSLVLGDTAHQLSLAARLGEAGIEWKSLPESSFSLGVRKYFTTAYPIGPQAALGLTAPMGFQDVAWLYQPFLALMVAATSLSLNGLVARWVRSRAGRAAICFVAAQPSLVIAFALQGSIKEVTALATITLTVTLCMLAVLDRWPARAFIAPALAALATVGALGPAAVAYIGPPTLFAAGVWLWRRPFTPRQLGAAAAVVVAAVLLALPILSGASTAVTVNNATLSAAKDLGNLAGPLEPLQASGTWIAGDYRYAPPLFTLDEILAVALCVIAVLGGLLAIRRRSWGPLMLAATLGPVSLLLLRRGSPYADSKVMVLLSVVAPLLAMTGAIWLATGSERRWRVPGLLLALFVGAVVIASNALGYHEVQLASHDRYRELESIGEELKGRGPVIFAEYDEFAKHFMRDSQVLSQPEWPFEYPQGPLNVFGAPTHIDENRDGLHPTFKAPLDPDGITPSTLQVTTFLVLRRSPSTSRPPANYRLIRRGHYYEVWQRGREKVPRHLPSGGSIFRPAASASCPGIREMAREAAKSKGAHLAWVERRPLIFYDPEKASKQQRGFGFYKRVKYPLYPRAVSVDGAGKATARLRVPRAGRYGVWIMGSFGRETDVRIDGRQVGSVAYEIANSGSYLFLKEIRLAAGSHRLEISRGGGDLHPGNGGGYLSNLLYLGPVVLSPAESDARTVRYSSPRDWRRLCGRPLDWVEIVEPA